jgi:hypothetical protein
MSIFQSMAEEIFFQLLSSARNKLYFIIIYLMLSPMHVHQKDKRAL